MNRIKILLLATLTVALAIPAVAQEIKFQEKGWEKALKKASKQDKLIFVDAYTTWCGPCKWMSANVFTDDAVADFVLSQQGAAGGRYRRPVGAVSQEHHW